MRRFLLTLAVLLAASSASAQAQREASAGDVTFESVSQRLGSFETLRGRFVQSREIDGLSRPLSSSGRFVISRLGLYWAQSEPFESKLIARRDSLTQQVAGRPAVTVTADEQPIAVSIGRVFLGLFRGDRGQLDEHFNVDFEARGERWRLRLDPLGAPLAESVERVVVDGETHVERIRIDGIAQDVLTIELSGQSAEPAQLTEAERELYAP